MKLHFWQHSFVFVWINFIFIRFEIEHITKIRVILNTSLDVTITSKRKRVTALHSNYTLYNLYICLFGLNILVTDIKQLFDIHCLHDLTREA